MALMHCWRGAAQVGASNELPESEELDALYDRFLVRREVKQVSAAGLYDLLRAADTSPNAAPTASDGEDSHGALFPLCPGRGGRTVGAVS